MATAKKTRNIEQGYWQGGAFHPIRASSDYDPGEVGEEKTPSHRRLVGLAKKRKRMAKINPSPAQLRARKRFAAATKKVARLSKGATPAQRAKIRKQVFAEAKRSNPRPATKARKVYKSAAKSAPKGAGAKQARSYVRRSGKAAVKRGRTLKGKSVSVVKNGKRLYGAAAQAVLKSRAKRNGVLLGSKKKAAPKPKKRVDLRGPATRKRNADQRDSAHPISVKHHYRAGGPGYESAWKRAERHGQQRLFSMNKGKKRVTKKRNSATGIAREFLGRETPRTVGTMEAPSNAPARLAGLGILLKLKTSKEIFEFGEKDGFTLAANNKRKLHIIGGNERFEKNADLGTLRQIDYLATKDHMERKPVHYYHKFSSPYPTLKTDSDGMLQIVGGGFTIEPEGITG